MSSDPSHLGGELVPFQPAGEVAELGLTEEQLAAAFRLFQRMQQPQRQQVPAYLSNERLVDDWIRHHRFWAASTVAVRRCQLGKLAAYLAPTPLLCASEDDLLAYRDSRDVSAQTLAGAVAAMHSFYKYVTVTRRLRTDDPSQVVEPPRRPRYGRETSPRRVAESELAMLEKVVEYDPQLRAMVLLMGHHGFRVSDLAWLRVEDVTDDVDGPAAGWARVTGKGGVVRQVPLIAEAMAALAPFRRQGPGPMFRRPSDGQAYTANALSKKVGKLLREVGINGTPHGLRHRFATAYSRVDADPRNLQRLLGHADLNTTMIYTEVEPAAGAAGVVALSERTQRSRRATAGGPAGGGYSATS